MRRHPAFPLLVCLGAVTLALGLAAGPPAAAQDADATMETETTTVDTELCAACHEDVVARFAGPHAAQEASCAACHGDPTAHLEAGGGTDTIFSFGEDNPHTVNSRACLECHADDHPRFLRGAHARAGMDCQSCHSVHDPAPGSWANLKKSDGVTRPMDDLSTRTLACRECHGDVFTQFELNERHRLQEGILDCQSCHDPHGPSPRTQLAAFEQESCVECHGDKGGPFVFEHGSSRVDGCVACHAPHGSPNRHMLKFQRVGALCYSCHTAVPGFHASFTLETNCANCHSSIHGSNFDPFFLK